MRGQEVKDTYYTAEAGSTVITLKHLSTVKHVITVLYEDGETSGTCKTLSEEDSSETGDESYVVLWSSLAAVSLLCVAVLILNRKKFVKK